MSDEFISNTEENSNEPSEEVMQTDQEQVPVAPEGGVRVIPDTLSLFTGGFKLLASRFDILVIALAIAIAARIAPTLLAEMTGDENNILVILATLTSSIVGFVNAIVLVYVYTNHTQYPSYMDAVNWLGKKFFSYVWLVLCVAFLKMGGTLLLIVPGIILSVYAMFSLPVFVAEDKRGFRAIMRSRELVWGRFWKTVAPVALLSLLTFVTVLGLMSVLFAVMYSSSEVVTEMSFEYSLIITVIASFLQVAIAAAGAGLVVHMYHEYIQVVPEQALDTKVRKKYIVIAWIGAILTPFLIVLLLVSATFAAQAM